MFGNSRFDTHQHNDFTYLHIPKGQQNAQSLVLLHGMFGSLSNYDTLIEHIDDCNVFVPALPIHEFEANEISIKKMTVWLHRFVQEMKLQQPILLGNSLGGHLALNYALEYPADISALVLTGSSGLQEKDFGSTCPRRNDREYIRKQAGQTFYKDLVDDALLDDIMEVITTPSKLKNILTLTRDTHEYNMEQFLHKVRQNVLLIWGENDVITPPEAGKKFHRLLPNARLRWIEKCGHAPMMEHPQTFALFLNEFLIELQNKNKDKPTTDYEKNYSHY